MQHRDRLLTALNHREPDRIPIDLGAALACSINVEPYERLKERFGVDSPTTILHRFCQQASVDEKILTRFDVDVRGLRAGGVGAGEPSAWPETWEAEADEWGVLWAKPAFGHAADFGSPLHGEQATIGDLAAYPWPDPEDPARVAGLRDAALKLQEHTDYGIVLSPTLYPFDQCQMIRGYTNWLMDLVSDPRFAGAMLDRVTELIEVMVDQMLGEVGDLIDVICWGDDLSQQTGPLMDPELYRRLIKPRHRRVMEAMKRGTDGKIFFHSDGSAYWLIGDLIELGVDILNPLQMNCTNMEPWRVKKEFGQDISFWGGGCDSGSTLPFGTPEQVREEVRRNIEVLAPGGGWVFAPIHHIESEVPTENVLAMYEAALEFGSYSG